MNEILIHAQNLTILWIETGLALDYSSCFWVLCSLAHFHELSKMVVLKSYCGMMQSACGTQWSDVCLIYAIVQNQIRCGALSGLFCGLCWLNLNLILH